MPFTIDSARNIFPKTLLADAVPATSARFHQLGAIRAARVNINFYDKGLPVVMSL